MDDVIDILIEEQTEDVLHLGGVSATEETVEQGYFATKPLRNVRLRFNWLLLLFVTETFTGTVLRHYESELAKVVALSFFIPLLIGTGGNSGSQTVTTIVRGLAVGRDPAARLRPGALPRGRQRPRARPDARHRRVRRGRCSGARRSRSR